jgi:tetratricopeptide (TPR) repeat protein
VRRWIAWLSLLAATAVATGCLTRYHPEPGPYNVGVDHLDQGRYAKAVSSFKRALEIHPTDYRSEFNLGCAYEAQGKTEEAKTRYLRVIELDPANVPARINLAALARQAGDLDRARELLKEATNVDPDNPQGPSNLAQLALDEGDLSAAEKQLEEAIRRDPKHADSLYRLGRLHERKHETDAAVAAYIRAIDSNPDDFPSLFRLGSIELAQKEFRQAVRHLELATLIRGDFRPAWVNLSRAYAGLERLENAVLAAWEARDLAKDDDEKKEDRSRLDRLYRALLEGVRREEEGAEGPRDQGVKGKNGGRDRQDGP